MKRILVADDKASSRELIRTLLEHDGYEISEAEDGREAVDIARATLPDLILLDIQMPRLDGYAAVREMRLDERLHSVPIVALTASAMHSDRDRVFEAGFSAYITKPVSLRVLRDELTRLLYSPLARIGPHSPEACVDSQLCCARAAKRRPS
jgi:two-component system cell cycle response regulator DivK